MHGCAWDSARILDDGRVTDFGDEHAGRALYCAADGVVVDDLVPGNYSVGIATRTQDVSLEFEA